MIRWLEKLTRLALNCFFAYAERQSSGGLSVMASSASAHLLLRSFQVGHLGGAGFFPDRTVETSRFCLFIVFLVFVR